ncbi:MAG: hypothetical protein M1151_00335 [Candidatus Thermoplasmatota archaeon]|jgi:hypothetical protein|nr:hypothetical protein [Candidatus Thermoplasmatota archaeon]
MVVIRKRWLLPLLLYFGFFTLLILWALIPFVDQLFQHVDSLYQVLYEVVISIIVLAVLWFPFPLSTVIIALRLARRMGDIKINKSWKYLVSYGLNLVLVAASAIFYLRIMGLNSIGIIVVVIFVSGNLHSGHRRFLFVGKILYRAARFARSSLSS